MATSRYIRTTLGGYLKECRLNEDGHIGLVLYHGSSTLKEFKTFKDNQFFTVNDYIAENYAYNKGGLVYKVIVDGLNPFRLVGNYRKLGGRTMESEEPEQYRLEYDMISELYGEGALDVWLSRGFHPSPAYVFSGDWDPVINWAKIKGYDSLVFSDESFDTYIRDTSYLIFDGSTVNILDFYEPESNI